MDDHESQTGYLGAFSQSGLSLAARVEAARQQQVQRVRSAAAEAQWVEFQADIAALAARIDVLDDPTGDEIDGVCDLLVMFNRRLETRRPNDAA